MRRQIAADCNKFEGFCVLIPEQCFSASQKRNTVSSHLRENNPPSDPPCCLKQINKNPYPDHEIAFVFMEPPFFEFTIYV